MPAVPFDQLPDTARLWIFAAERPLAADERQRLLDRVDAFLGGWQAHGAPLSAGRDWRYDRFLFVAVDESAAGASGCSIDALVGDIRALEGELQVSLIDHAPVHYRNGEAIARVSREEFAALADAGAVTLETAVFDNSLSVLGAVREGAWEVPAGRSWHARAFF